VGCKLSNTVYKELKIFGPLFFFLLHINDLPVEIKKTAKPTLFVDSFSLIVTTFDSRQLQEYFNTVIGKIMRWFQANSLTPNFNKTYCMYFKMLRRHTDSSPIKYMNAQISSTQDMFFLG
jgi:hypothetical protein